MAVVMDLPTNQPTDRLTYRDARTHHLKTTTTTTTTTTTAVFLFRVFSRADSWPSDAEEKPSASSGGAGERGWRAGGRRR